MAPSKAVRLCSIERCRRPVSAHGWCGTHYQRWRRHGDPQVIIRIQGDDMARFWSKVDRLGPLARNAPDLGRCWLWIGGRTTRGYGVITVAGRPRRAHRWIWEREHGPVPGGLELDHFACDRRDCVNPSHVRPVTHTENMARGGNATKTHCPAGHPYDAVNTLISNGSRNCKACRAQWQRAYRSKKKMERTWQLSKDRLQVVG